MAKSRLIGEYPIIGIRPIIDAREGMLNVRASLEELTMRMAHQAKELLEQNVFYTNGEPVKVLIADSTIGRVAESAVCAEKFKKALPDYTADIIEAALELIAGLNPYPAYGFASSEPTAYIQPDVWVKEGKDGWKVIGNDAAWPKIRLNKEYCDLLQEAGSGDAAWKDKLNEARQKIDILELRKNTVIRLAEYIVAKQEDFFTFGEIGLTPMLLKDAAAELDAVLEELKNRGFIVGKNGIGRNVMAFQPPLIITEDNISDVLNALELVLTEKGL